MCKKLLDLIGPIAPLLLRQGDPKARSIQHLIEFIVMELPPAQRQRFRQQAASLLETAIP